MPSAYAYFLGGPCDGRSVTLTYERKPPSSVVCRGTTYGIKQDARGTLVYTTAGYVARIDAAAEARGQRDVFRAWHRLMHTLEHRVSGERRRIEGARHRIRRAVR